MARCYCVIHFKGVIIHAHTNTENATSLSIVQHLLDHFTQVIKLSSTQEQSLNDNILHTVEESLEAYFANDQDFYHLNFIFKQTCFETQKYQKSSAKQRIPIKKIQKRNHCGFQKCYRFVSVYNQQVGMSQQMIQNYKVPTRCNRFLFRGRVLYRERETKNEKINMHIKQELRLTTLEFR